MFRVHRETLAVAALGLIWYALPHLARGPLPEMVGIPLFLAFAVVAPGVALTRMLRAHPRDALETAAVWSAHGLFVLLVTCFVWALSGMSLGLFRALLAPAVVAFFARAPHPDHSLVDVMRDTGSRGDRRARLALLALLAGFAIAVAVTGPPLDYSKDAIDHIGYVNEVVRTGDAFPTTAVYIDGGADGADLRKCLMHAVYGLAAAQLGIDGVRVIAVLNAYLFLMMALAIYSAALTMFANRAAAVLSCAFFVLAFEGGSELARTAFYPNRFGIGMLALFTASAVAYMPTRSRMSRSMCAIFAFAGAAIHIQFAVLACVVVGIIAVWRTCAATPSWREHIRRVATVAVATAVGLAPVVIYRYVTAYQTNELHHVVAGALFVAGDWFVMSPLHAWNSLGWFGLAALAAIVPLWRHRRDVPGVGFVAAALPTVLFVQYNPIILKPLYGILSYLVYRLDHAVPVYMLVAYFLVTLPARARETAPRRAAWFTAAAVVFAVAAVVSSIAPLAGNNAFSPSTLRAERRVNPRAWESALARISATVPATAVIASDPVTSYAMSAFTKSFVMCTLDQHAPPNDTRFAGRMSAARDVMSPYAGMNEKIVALQSHYARYIVINTALPPTLTLHSWTVTPDIASDAIAMFETHPKEFKRTDLGDGLVMFEWSGNRPRHRGETTPPPLVEYLPTDTRPVGQMSGEAALVGARLDGATVRPGDALAIDLYWSRTHELPPGGYIAAVRFDRTDLSLPLGGRPFPKLTRKLVEAIRGERYRFRRDHMILAGIYGPDAWPADAIVRDRAELRVPRDLAPGRYRVQARMLRHADAANLHLRDLFFDDDMFAGADIGVVTIGSE